MAWATASDGIQLEWTSTGTGPAVLLIAGQASSMHGWCPIVSDLAERHTVIRFEHRGVGASGFGEPGRYNTRLFAADAVRVLDAAGVDTAAVYGHSMGGRVAQWVAIDAPTRVDRLVLAATTGGDDRGVPRHKAVSRLLHSGDRGALSPLFFTAGFSTTHPEVVHRFFDSVTTHESRKLHARASRGHDAWDDLNRITAPTLVVHGTADVITPPANATHLAAAIAGSELLLHDGGLHGLHLEADPVRHRVTDFLARMSPVPT